MKLQIITLLFFILLISTNIVIAEESIDINDILKINNTSTTSFDDNHLVLIEYCTRSNNKDSIDTSFQLYNLLSSENHDFLYITLISDKNQIAQNRIEELDATNYPDVFFDGGYINIEGKQNTEDQYINSIYECSSREVFGLEMYANAIWDYFTCGDDVYIDVEIINKESKVYNGDLIICIVEINSRWKDSTGKPYNYALIDYELIEDITIDSFPSGSAIYNFNWKPVDRGYPDINGAKAYNLLVIASVFSKSNGFSDQTIVTGFIDSNQPDKPSKPDGQSNGNIKNSYTFKTVSKDPESDEIIYGWDWNGDYIVDEWTDFYESGVKISINHTWERISNSDIHVIAKDKNDLESFWSDPLIVSMKYSIKNSRIFQNIYYKIFQTFSYF